MAGDGVVTTVGTDGTVRIWSNRQGEHRGRTLVNLTREAQALAVGQLAGQDVIAAALADRTVHMWRPSGKPVSDPLTDHTDTINAVAIGRLGSRNIIASGSHDGAVRVWNEDTAITARSDPTDHMRRITTLAVGHTARGPLLVSASDDNTVRIWDANGRPMGDALSGFPAPTSVDIGCLGGADVVAAVDHAGRIRLWNVSGQPKHMPLTQQMSGATAIRFDPAGKHHAAVTAHLDGEARLWDSQGRRVGEPFGGTAKDITTLAAGRLHHQPVVALGYSDGSVLAFNPTDPTTRRTLAPAGALVSAMTINDGIAVLGYADGTIRVLDGATTEVAHLRPVRRGRVTAVAVHLHDGHLIVVATSTDRTAHIWNGRNGRREILELLETPYGVALVDHRRLVIATGRALCEWQLHL